MCDREEKQNFTSSLVPSLTPGHFVTAFWWQRLWTTHVQTVKQAQTNNQPFTRHVQT